MNTKQLFSIAVIICGLLAGTIAAMWLVGSGPFRPPPPPPPPARDLSRASAGAAPPHARGADTAPVTLEEFADFQCPPCGSLHPELKKVEAEYGGRVRVIFRHYPLASIHLHAWEAAQAAEAAGLQGRFWEMHDLLFERQEEWSEAKEVRPLFTEYARSLKLDSDQFTRDMDAAGVKERISADRGRGDSVEITGTPSLFLNGREVQGRTPDGLRAAIDTALKEVKP